MKNLKQFNNSDDEGPESESIKHKKLKTNDTITRNKNNHKLFSNEYNEEEENVDDDSEFSEDEGNFEDEDEEENEEDNISKNLLNQIADVPFETLRNLKSDGRDSSKRNKKIKIDSETKSKPEKNKPLELSTKKQVSRFKDVIRKPTKKLKDPRFESSYGDFDEKRFKSTYNFLFDEKLPNEKKLLLQSLKKEKDEERREDIKNQIKFIDKQLGQEERRKKMDEQKKKLKENVKLAVKEGRKPFFPKKSELKKEDLAEKFKLLKESGKLEAFLAKKQKKIAKKQHTKVPFRRNV